jgi:hypothetical protein
MRRRNLHCLQILLSVVAGPFLLLTTAFAESIVVKSVRGSAEIHRSKSQANRWRALQKGAPVKPGDTVRTGKNARLELKIDDGSRVVLGSKSRVQVAESAPSRIFNLAVGRIKSFVKKLKPESKFEIRTPLATAAVRGTVFEMGFDEEAKAGFLDVGRGVVSLSQDGRDLDVRAGQRMDFLPNVPLGEAPGRESRGLAAPSSEDLARDAFRHEVGLGMSKEMVMAAAAEEIRAAEYQEGKTLMDVNGNRVRLEEYIIRNPAEVLLNPDRAFKLVTLNERADRFDYFYYLGQFNQTLPTDLSVALNDVRGKLNDRPGYFLENYEMGMSNTRDSIKDVATGGHVVKVEFDGTQYTLTAPDDPLAHTRIILADEVSTANGELLHKLYDPVGDRFVTVTDAQFQAGGGQVAVYDGANDVFRPMASNDIYYRTSFDSYKHLVLGEGKPAFTKQSYVPTVGVTTILALDQDATFTFPTDPSDPTNDTVVAINETPSGEDALHNRVTLFYRDGTFESADTYIISDDGKIGPLSAFAGLTSGTAFKNELLKWNYEQVLTASEFDGRKIDLVVEPKILIRSGLIQ